MYSNAVQHAHKCFPSIESIRIFQRMSVAYYTDLNSQFETLVKTVDNNKFNYRNFYVYFVSKTHKTANITP